MPQEKRGRGSASGKSVPPAKKRRKARAGRWIPQDYYVSTPATWLAAKVTRSPAAAEAGRLARGTYVKVTEVTVGDDGVKWGEVELPDGSKTTTGWVPLQSGLIKPARKPGHLGYHGQPKVAWTPAAPSPRAKQKPASIIIVDRLSAQRGAATKKMMLQVFASVPEQLLLGKSALCIPIVYAAVARGSPPGDPPRCAVVGCRQGSLITLAFVMTRCGSRRRGLLRLVLATMMEKACTADDTIIVVSTAKAIPVWQSLGFIVGGRDPRAAAVPFTDKGAVCMEWPQRVPFLDTRAAWRDLIGFRKARVQGC